MILVIDSGTTNTKVILFDLKGTPVCGSSCPVKTTHPGPGISEQAAEEWWCAVLRAAGRMRRLNRDVRFSKIDAVVTSAQGATFVPWDGGLAPLRSGITWLDVRATGEAAALNLRYGENFFYYKNGHFLRGWSPLAEILWLKENQRGIYRKTRRISFVSDYLNYRLTGRFFLDQTAAGMTSFFNVGSGGWDKELMDISGIGNDFLPEIVPAGKPGGTLIGEAAKSLGLPEGTPVISGGHDQYCASLGAGATRPGDCLLSCGTAWALLVSTRKMLFKPDSGWTLGRHLRAGEFGLMGAIANGGVLLDWMKKNLRLQIQRPKPGAVQPDNIRVSPYFSENKGSIDNLGLNSTGGDIYRAVLDALVNQAGDYLGRIKNETVLRRICLVGGGAKEPLLPSMLTKATGLKIVIPETSEAAARGAALLAIEYLERRR